MCHGKKHLVLHSERWNGNVIWTISNDQQRVPDRRIGRARRGQGSWKLLRLLLKQLPGSLNGNLEMVLCEDVFGCRGGARKKSMAVVHNVTRGGLPGTKCSLPQVLVWCFRGVYNIFLTTALRRHVLIWCVSHFTGILFLFWLSTVFCAACTRQNQQTWEQSYGTCRYVQPWWVSSDVVNAACIWKKKKLEIFLFVLIIAK